MVVLKEHERVKRNELKDNICRNLFELLEPNSQCTASYQPTVKRDKRTKELFYFKKYEWNVNNGVYSDFLREVSHLQVLGHHQNIISLHKVIKNDEGPVAIFKYGGIPLWQYIKK